MQLVFMLSQFAVNSYMYLCARVIDRTYVTICIHGHDKYNHKQNHFCVLCFSLAAKQATTPLRGIEILR